MSPPVLSESALQTALLITTTTRRRHIRRRLVIICALVAAVVAAAVAMLTWNSDYSLAEVAAVIMGQTVPGASFTIGEVRLPRTIIGLLGGACFALAGITFQTMLRNPLASPDIIGISAGASTGAVVAIVVFGLSGTAVSVSAVVTGLGVAALCYLLSEGTGAGGRLVLIGIGIASMATSVTSYVLANAAQNDLQTALRWLSGSLNGAGWGEVWSVAVALAVLGPILISRSRSIEVLALGDDAARALGEHVSRTRAIVVIAAVGLIAVATAATGPIAFVAFLAGPITARILGPNGSLLVPSACVGMLLVLSADLVGQYALWGRYPVGVVTGALGAPFLLYLLIQRHRGSI